MTVAGNAAAATGAPPPHDAAALWASLSEVEKTCLQVAFVRWDESHRRWPDGTALYDDPYGGLWVDACIPEPEQKKMRSWKAQGDRIADVMAVRTAELDARIHEAVFGSADLAGDREASSPITQLVIVGAGADMRAWRLPWPPGFRLFEVDTATVLDFKARVLQAAGPVFREALKVDRVEVVADAAQAPDMWAKLVASGLDASRPVFWLLEGLIGYLPLREGSELLATLHANSTPGSRIIVTVPPGPAVKAAKEAAAAARSSTVSGDEVEEPAPVVHMGDGVDGGVTTVQANMPHVTFEDPDGTFGRVRAAGWEDTQLLDFEFLAAKYADVAVRHVQPIVLARKA